MKTSVFALAHLAYPRDFVRRAKMILRLLLFSPYNRKLVSIFNYQSLQAIPLANPRIFQKIFRNYQCCGLSMAERLRLLESHYLFIREEFNDYGISSIYLNHNLNLCSFSLADGSEKLSVRLAHDNRFSMEGELTIGLHDAIGNLLYSITFSFQTSKTERMAFIGCLIGRGRDKEGNLLSSQLNSKRLTKELHGIRPKNLIVILFQSLCKSLNITSILAVGSNSHVHGDNPRRRNRIIFDYDQFWEEMGGKRSEDRKFYTLPLDYARRSHEEMPSNKRALYLRRYALLDDLDAQIMGNLSRSIITNEVSY